MKPKNLNIIGLIFGIIGVVMIFIWGPPQPNLSPEVFIEADGSPDQNIEKRKEYELKSRAGLFFVLIGFFFQLVATWISPSCGEKTKPEKIE
ncbi:hypothetical protein [Cerasicoccus fimbriatus]|uniref:hypothetical protein n=1 Tax=Cerasicoccus fimbriatus TaxID=3014554 RepID=UPI0022B3D168|nr:hypothetical protein [Cerasicoccus sp. TK19100]